MAQSTPVPPDPAPTVIDIEVGSVVIDAVKLAPDALSPANINPDTDPLSSYTDYMVHNHYEKDRHIYMMGVASPTGMTKGQNSVYFVQLANPTLLWICEWTACRWNQQPVMPDPTVSDDNWVLLDDWWEPAPVALGNDGITPLYRINGVFVYGHKNPADATIDNAVFPRMPWVKNVYTRTIDSTKLDETIAGLGAIGVGAP